MKTKKESALNIVLDFQNIAHKFNNKLCSYSGALQLVLDDETLKDSTRKIIELALKTSFSFSQEILSISKRINNCYDIDSKNQNT